VSRSSETLRKCGERMREDRGHQIREEQALPQSFNAMSHYPQNSTEAQRLEQHGKKTLRKDVYSHAGSITRKKKTEKPKGVKEGRVRALKPVRRKGREGYHVLIYRLGQTLHSRIGEGDRQLSVTCRGGGSFSMRGLRRNRRERGMGRSFLVLE